jgi:TonB family protein
MILAGVLGCSVAARHPVIEEEGGGPVNIAESQGLVEPRLISRPDPQYSPEVIAVASGWGQETYVELEVVLKSDGAVEQVSVLGSQPLNNAVVEAFQEQSIKFVKLWQFEPAALTSGEALDVKFSIRLWWNGNWGLPDPIHDDRWVPCRESVRRICGVDGLQPNHSMNLPVRPVTFLACARSAPGPPAGYAER